MTFCQNPFLRMIRQEKSGGQGGKFLAAGGRPNIVGHRTPKPTMWGKREGKFSILARRRRVKFAIERRAATANGERSRFNVQGLTWKGSGKACADWDGAYRARRFLVCRKVVSLRALLGLARAPGRPRVGYGEAPILLSGLAPLGRIEPVSVGIVPFAGGACTMSECSGLRGRTINCW